MFVYWGRHMLPVSLARFPLTVVQTMFEMHSIRSQANMQPILMYSSLDSGLINYLHKPPNVLVNSIVTGENHSWVTLNIFVPGVNWFWNLQQTNRLKLCTDAITTMLLEVQRSRNTCLRKWAWIPGIMYSWTNRGKCKKNKYYILKQF